VFERERQTLHPLAERQTGGSAQHHQKSRFPHLFLIDFLRELKEALNPAVYKAVPAA
jgi:hypothetical protein